MTDFEDNSTDGEREAAYDAKLSRAIRLIEDMMSTPGVRDKVGEITDDFDYLGVLQLSDVTFDGVKYRAMNISRYKTGDDMGSETTSFSFEGEAASRMYLAVVYANGHSEWYREYDDPEDAVNYEAELLEAQDNPELVEEMLVWIEEKERFNDIVMGSDMERRVQLADDTPEADELLRLLALAWQDAKMRGEG